MSFLDKEDLSNNTYNINGLKVYEMEVTYNVTSQGGFGKTVALPMDCPLGVVGWRVQGGSNTYISVYETSINQTGYYGNPALDYVYYSDHTGSGTITFYVLYHDNADYDNDFKTDSSDFA